MVKDPSKNTESPEIANGDAVRTEASRTPEVLGSPVPLFRIMVDDILHKIADGTLQVGDPIPSLHILAKDYNSALGTAVRAQDCLKIMGVVYFSPGKGTFVQEGANEKSIHILMERYASLVRTNAMRLMRLPEGRGCLKSLFAELAETNKENG